MLATQWRDMQVYMREHGTWPVCASGVCMYIHMAGVNVRAGVGTPVQKPPMSIDNTGLCHPLGGVLDLHFCPTSHGPLYPEPSNEHSGYRQRCRLGAHGLPGALNLSMGAAGGTQPVAIAQHHSNAYLINIIKEL